MTREEKLFSMVGAELIKEAEKLGVKLSHKGTHLKESKEKAVAKILAAEAKIEAELNQQEQEKEIVDVDLVQEVQEIAEEPEEPKKEKKIRAKIRKTFEELVADIPAPANIRFIRNKKEEVIVKQGNMQIFRYTGRRLVCIRESNMIGLDYTNHSYGYVTTPTADNMITIFKNVGIM